MALRAQLFLSSIYGNFPLKQRRSGFRHACCVFYNRTIWTGNCELRACKNHATVLSSTSSSTYRHGGRTFVSQNASQYIARNQHYQTKVNWQLSRSMSQSSDSDVDTERMEKAFQKSYQAKHSTIGSRLIYEIRGVGMMRFCSVAIYCTSLMALYMSPDLMSTILEHDSVNSETFLSLATVVLAVGVMPTCLTLFNRRLILKLFFDKGRDTYVAMILSPMLTLQKIEFSRNEVIPVRNNGTFLEMLKMSTVKVKGRSLYVNPYNFSVPSDFNYLMGYE